MKVLHLLQSNRFSGAENVVFQIIRMFQNDDVEMLYCSRDGQIREAAAEHGVCFVPIGELSIKEVKRVIREHKPDIIHAHDMRAGFVASCACRKIPLVSHIHNNSFDSRGLSVKSVAYWFAGMKAKHIFWVSQSAFYGYVFHKTFEKKSTILYNIVDIDSLYQKMKIDNHTYDFDIIYLGRLTYPKNPQRLIRVCEKVVKKMPNVKIAVIGTGDLEEETKALCSELNLQNNVYFLGFQSNPLKILHDSKAMVMTSRWEGTPMCALEAMALGVPIISTPTDGLKDLVVNNETGFLSNDDDILVEMCCKVVLDTEYQNTLSKNSYEKALQLMNIQKYKTKISNAYIQRQ